MDNVQSNHSFLKFFVPFIVAYFGSKAIFYYFSFEYSLFSDGFHIEKLLVDLGVFGGLFYLGTIMLKFTLASKTKPNSAKI
ncbi:hypothetical protein [Thalassotalea marina]|uniref:Uncharacterized protein n=1 Tax=Thalassotalea marina TaxID=1673741 RepID=A0A919BJ24_9GAMM|nr:hypothetical protein [Thalassotalea marina]GHF94817.1 hypothetical protein GCM10017161_23890 [Thalassotalea marina]